MSRHHFASVWRGVLAGLLLLTPAICGSENSVVTTVTNGDTIEAEGRSIRLQGIDASEAGQPHGNRATGTLKSPILHRKVRLRVRGTDRYDRLIAVAYRGERNVDRWLVRQGHAWEYNNYLEDTAIRRVERHVQKRENQCSARSSGIIGTVILLIHSDSSERNLVLGTGRT